MTQRCGLALTTLAALAGCGRVDFAVQEGATGDGRSDDGPRATYAQTVLASGPALYFRLGETGGGVAVDATGSVMSGVYDFTGGTIAYSQASVLTRDADTAVRMDGGGNDNPGNDANMLINGNNVSWAGDFTVEMFVQPHTRPTSAHVVFVCESYLVNGFRFGWDNNDILSLWTSQAGGGLGSVDTVATVTYGTYLHTAVVHQGASFSIYMDGVLAASDAGGPLTYIPADTSSECGIGGFHGMSSAATYDELAIYERALAPAEIAAHFAAR